MKKFLIGIFVFTALAIVNLNANQFAKVIKAQAKESYLSIKNKDFKKFANRVYPELIKKFGSEDRLISMTKDQIEKMEKSGNFLYKVEFGTLGKIFECGDEKQCVLEQKITMKTSQGLIRESSYLLCLSKDQGENWYFIDLGSFDLKNLKTIVPCLNESIKIPKKKNPEILKKY